MPRIPEGSFNKTPSVRVGAQRFSPPQKTGMDNLIEQTANVTNVLAKLQDQRERSEAYNAANDVQRGYQQKKARSAVNLENSNANGQYDYTDPLEKDEDGNSIRYFGNVKDDFKQLEKYYVDSQSKLKDLERSDIAMDLAQNYVADDLNVFKVRAGKVMAQKQQAQQTQNLFQNIDNSMVKVLDLTAANSSPAVIEANLTSTLNQIDREIATVGVTIGDANVEKAKEYKDRLLNKTAGDILQAGYSSQNIAVADRLVSKIQDPLSRKQAERRMVGVKKRQAAKADMTLLQDSGKVAKGLMTKAYADAQTMIKAKETSEKLKNAYYDPQYSQLSGDQRRALTLQLDSAIVSKHLIQENLDDENVKFIDDLFLAEQEVLSAQLENRSPSAESVKNLNTAQQRLDEFIDEGIQTTGLRELAGSEDYREQLRTSVKRDLTKLYDNLGRTLPELAWNKYPNMTKEQAYREIETMGNSYKVKDLQYVPDESIKQFRSRMKEDLKKDPNMALSTFLQQMEGAGEEYARAVAMDLTKGDKKLETILPASELLASGRPDLAKQIIDDTYIVGTTEKIIDGAGDTVSNTKLEKAFSKVGNDEMFLGVQRNMTISGLKSAIFNRAKVLMVEGRETDVDDAMEAATNQFKEVYSIKQTRDGRGLVIATATLGGLTREQLDSSEMERGLQLSVMEPSSYFEKDMIMAKDEKGKPKKRLERSVIPIDERRDILARYGIVSPQAAEGLQEEELKLYFKENFALQPDSRKLNNHILTFKGEPVTLKSGRVIDFTTEQIYNAGVQTRESSSYSRPAMSSSPWGR